MIQQPYSAFTTASNGRVNVLKNQCKISRAWAPDGDEPQPQMQIFDAIWDTGATNSVITKAVVDSGGLVPTGVAKVNHAGGSSQVATYLVNIVLPNSVGYPGVRVSTGEVVGGDILIGMDIIGTGDFTVTNFNGTTTFSFRHPSIEHIDFVRESKKPQFQHGGTKNVKRTKPQVSGKKGRKKTRN